MSGTLVALVASLPPRLSALPLPDYRKIPTFCAGISQTAAERLQYSRHTRLAGKNEWCGTTHPSTARQSPGEEREGAVRRITRLSKGEALT